MGSREWGDGEVGEWGGWVEILPFSLSPFPFPPCVSEARAIQVVLSLFYSKKTTLEDHRWQS